jgi:hypothetical protein
LGATSVARLGDVVFDAAHPASLARFWAAALDGYTVTPYDDEELARLRAKGITDPEEDPSVLVEPPVPGAPRLFFNRVPEPKTVKNRVHLDLRAVDVVDEVNSDYSINGACQSDSRAYRHPDKRKITGRLERGPARRCVSDSAHDAPESVSCAPRGVTARYRSGSAPTP